MASDSLSLRSGGSGGSSPLPEVDLQQVSDDARAQLADIMGTVEGEKDLVIQPELMSLLDHVAPYSFLKKLDIDQIFKLEVIMNVGGIHRFYIIRPEIMAVSQIAGHIQMDKKAREQRTYHIIFVPRRVNGCDYVLETEGVFGYARLYEWNMHLIPLDAHLLSLERYNAFQSLYIDKDFTMLHSIAKSLISLEYIYGTIPKVHGKGHYSQMVWDLYRRLKDVMHIPVINKEGGSVIHEVIFLDRQCDLVTPLCSQLTYEGILDDSLGIKSGYVHVSKEITGKDQDTKVLVNTKDPVFGVIRSLHFSSVPQTLSTITKQLKEIYKEGSTSSTIPALKDLVKRLPELTKKHESLSTHLKVSEKIMSQKKKEEFKRLLFFERAIVEAVDKMPVTDFIEECIQRQINYKIPLRLMCLMSTTNNGIKPKYFLTLKQQFLHSYGHKHLVTFHNLFKVGLLQHKEEEPTKPTVSHAPKSTFKSLSKLLKLVPKDPGSYDVHNPKDMSYVYGGAYKPLSCAVVEYVVKNGNWKGLDDVIKTWSGPAFTHYQPEVRNTSKAKVVLVYFIGGVTFSEINALQTLGKLSNCEYIIATTNTINPTTMIESTLGGDL